MTVRAQIVDMVDKIPEHDLQVVLDVVRRFVPVDPDDILTPDDIVAHEAALRDLEAGELVSIEDIDWD